MYLTLPSCKFDYYTPQCSCDPIDDVVESKNAARYRKAPEQALRVAIGEPVDLEALKAISVFATRQDGIRSPQLERHFVGMILEGYEISSEQDESSEFKLERCHWELPLVGIYNMLVSIRRDARMGFGDKAIIANICGDYGRIVDVVMKDLPRLLPAGQHADHLRNTIVKTTAILAENRKFKERLLLDHKALSLTLTCWTHMSAPNRDYVNTLIHELYEQCDECTPNSVDPQRYIRAVHILDVETLVQKFKGWLTSPQILDESLQLELQTVYDFFRGLPSYGNAFVAAQSQVHVMAAMQRQKQYGDASYSQMIYHIGFMIITLLTLSPDYSGFNELPPESIELAMIALSADSESREIPLPPSEDVCRWHSGYRTLEDMGYYDYVARITQGLESEPPTCDIGNKVPGIAARCVTQVERIYIPVSRRLLVRSIEGYSFAKDVHFLWKRLTDALGMTEATVRAKWERDGECWNPWCAQRGEKPVKMKWCKRCFVVVYCSIDCQKANWEEHKWTCKASPAGSRSRTTTRSY